jgi:hypothetical protein
MNKDLEIRCYETQDGLKFQIMDCSALTIMKKQFDKLESGDLEGAIDVLKELDRQ